MKFDKILPCLLYLVLFFGFQPLKAQNLPPGNHGLYFDGIDDFVDLGTSPLSAFNSSFTIECWVKVAKNTGDIQQFVSSWIENGAASFQFGVDASGSLVLKEVNGNYHQSAAGVVSFNNQWTHVAANYDIGTNNILYYVNGVLVGTVAKTGIPFSGATVNLLVGMGNAGSLYTPLNAFNGQIDELRIFNTSRTAAEIQNDMITTTTNGASGFWRFEEGTGQSASDASTVNPSGRLGLSTAADSSDPLWALRVYNGSNAGATSLRGVILDANSLPGENYVDFSIPISDTSYNAANGGYWSISPQSFLPTISESIFLDGWSQTGFNTGKPLIEINGANLDDQNGLNISAPNCIVRGFCINNFTGANGNNIGIGVFGNNNIIQGNYLGTDITGTTAKPNSQAGIWIQAGQSFNLIGTNLDGVNDDWERNVVSGNSSRGGFILDGSQNIIRGNYIGLAAGGFSPLGNTGQGIECQGSNNLIENNTIAYNSDYGVKVITGTGNRITLNSFYCNANGGILLQNNGNNNKAVPTVNTVNDTEVKGTSAPNDSIEVYHGYPGCGAGSQGEDFVGKTKADASGNWSLSRVNNVEDSFTALAIDASNNTSGFSNIMPYTILESNALDFDGIDDYAKTAFSSPTGDQTYEAWVKADPGSTGFIEVISAQSKLTDDTHLEHILLGITDSSRARFGLYDYQNLHSDQIVGTTYLRDYAWHHLAGVIQGPNIYLYVDGVLEDSKTLDPGNSARGKIDTLRLGALLFNDTLAEFFKGQVDEVRIWDKARTCSEIQANRFNELTGTEAGLIVYYNFNQGIGGGYNVEGLTPPEVLDISGHGKDATLVNFAKQNTSSNFVPSDLLLYGTSPSLPPGIKVFGNNLEIADNDFSPNTADGTDFGNVIFGQPKIVNFSIENSGASILWISNITNSNTDFIIGGYPLAVDSLGSIIFSVTFIPGVTGTDTISIYSNDCGTSVFKFLISAQTSSTLNQPTNLHLQVLSTTQIALSWQDNANNEDGYLVERKDGAAGTFNLIAPQLQANTVGYVDSGLTPGITYFYRVRAFSSFADSPYSEELGAVTGVPTAIEPNVLEVGTLIFPNPTEDKATLKMDNTYLGKLELLLINAQGQIILQKQLEKKQSLLEQEIDLSTQAQGFYYLLIRHENASVGRKLLKK